MKKTQNNQNNNKTCQKKQRQRKDKIILGKVNLLKHYRLLKLNYRN